MCFAAKEIMKMFGGKGEVCSPHEKQILNFHDISIFNTIKNNFCQNNMIRQKIHESSEVVFYQKMR